MNDGILSKYAKEMRAPGSFWRDRALICLAVVLSYASVWPNRFLFDDILLIRNNAFFRTPAGLLKIFFHRNGDGGGWSGGFYRPVPMAAHFFIYWFSYQLRALLDTPLTLGFHALNIALQALNGCLLLAFGVRAGFNRYAALAAALLWAVHPLHTEAVAYMSSTPELMWSTFCLLGLITLLPKEAPVDGVVDQADAFTPRKIKLSLILFTLALLSKESAVVFPALATATLFFISKDRLRLSTYAKTKPLWILSFLYILVIAAFILRFSLIGTLDPAVERLYQTHAAVRVWTALATLPTYARLIVWPESLYFRRAFPVFASPWNAPSLLGLFMVCAALLQMAWGRGKRGLALTFGLLWFAAAQSPNTGIVVPVDGIVSEHWMYMPTMGLFLGIAESFSGILRGRRKAGVLLVAAMTSALCVATFRQNMVWRNIDTLYKNIKRNHGSLIIINGDEAVYLMAQRQFVQARALLQSSIAALPDSLAPDKAGMYQTLGLTWIHVIPKDRWEFTEGTVREALPKATPAHIAKAVADLENSIRLAPRGSIWSHKFLAVIYDYQGDKKKAAAERAIAKQLKTEDQ